MMGLVARWVIERYHLSPGCNHTGPWRVQACPELWSAPGPARTSPAAPLLPDRPLLLQPWPHLLTPHLLSHVPPPCPTISKAPPQGGAEGNHILSFVGYNKQSRHWSPDSNETATKQRSHQPGGRQVTTRVVIRALMVYQTFGKITIHVKVWVCCQVSWRPGAGSAVFRPRLCLWLAGRWYLTNSRQPNKLGRRFTSVCLRLVH